MIFERGQKIVFIGDSITDAGRRTDPVGNGSGYFNLVRSFVLARYPELELDIVNRGIGGDTVRHLQARWDADVIAEQPDWLSVKIGINDVWRTFDRGGDGAVPIDEFESIYRELLTRAVDANGTKLSSPNRTSSTPTARIRCACRWTSTAWSRGNSPPSSEL